MPMMRAAEHAHLKCGVHFITVPFGHAQPLYAVWGDLAHDDFTLRSEAGPASVAWAAFHLRHLKHHEK
jgi:hypothetical protein